MILPVTLSIHAILAVMATSYTKITEWCLYRKQADCFIPSAQLNINGSYILLF